MQGEPIIQMRICSNCNKSVNDSETAHLMVDSKHAGRTYLYLCHPCTKWALNYLIATYAILGSIYNLAYQVGINSQVLKEKGESQPTKE